MSRVAITVSVKEVEPGAAATLARRLRSMGVEVREVHELIGVISCDADPDGLDALRALPEVEAVEEARQVQLAPPESDVQEAGRPIRGIGP
ncbi:MAG: hypothetical protein ACR2N6_05365 [Miltoncostaeaceae bacterium]